MTALLTVAEVAAELRVSRMTVHRAIERGELTAIRFGSVSRVDRSDLDTFLAAHRTGDQITQRRRRSA
jgi:excisionase family DNA binding protein